MVACDLLFGLITLLLSHIPVQALVLPANQHPTFIGIRDDVSRTTRDLPRLESELYYYHLPRSALALPNDRQDLRILSIEQSLGSRHQDTSGSDKIHPPSKSTADGRSLTNSRRQLPTSSLNKGTADFLKRLKFGQSSLSSGVQVLTFALNQQQGQSTTNKPGTQKQIAQKSKQSLRKAAGRGRKSQRHGRQG
ncbi:unnamed protein product [Somion occarium]|uniref:Uncharacterized protein n=1 Tax=Somion occarium TaxID=3059160 RepID=A0ABP1CSM9_9APHY